VSNRRVGGGVTPPRRFGNTAYPADALAAGIDGAVVAEILVNESGVVADARVLKSIPPLDEAALKAVREWRYDPTIVDGKAVPVKMTVTVNFSRAR
jgi:periplasmic protein TonB